MNSLIELAKNGDQKAFGEICEKVKPTFNMLVEKNRLAFKLPFEKDDYRDSFTTKVWNVIQAFDCTRNCSFNTYFYNRIQWELSDLKFTLKKGHFEMPISGLNLGEDTDAVDYFESSLADPKEVDFGKLGDIDTILERAKKMPDPEKFFIESVLSGSKIKEVIESMEQRYGFSRCWCYYLGGEAVNKLKKYVSK